MSKFTRVITFNSLYAAWYWGYLPFGPPKASCHVSIKVNIFSLTLKSGCTILKLDEKVFPFKHTVAEIIVNYKRNM